MNSFENMRRHVYTYLSFVDDNDYREDTLDMKIKMEDYTIGKAAAKGQGTLRPAILVVSFRSRYFSTIVPR